MFPFNYEEEEKQEYRNKGEEKMIRHEKVINDELVRKNFRIQNLEKLKNSKNNTERNDTHVNLIKSGLRDLK